MARRSTRPTRVKASYEATLVYYNEPQLVLFSRAGKRRIVAVAISDSEQEYPFFAAEVSLEQWEKYLREICDLRSLFEYPRFKKWYKFDFSDLDDQDQIRLSPLSQEDIRPEYLPAGQFFARSHTESLGDQLGELGVEQFLIDGSWDFSDFSSFYSKISDLYAIYLSLTRWISPATELAIKGNIKNAFQRYPLKGGSSYRFFYRDLFNTQSILDRLAVDSIQYASPGHVDVHARKDVFDEIKASLYAYRSNLKASNKAYYDLRNYLSKAHLLNANAEDFASDNPRSSRIEELTKDLSSKLSFNRLDDVMRLTDNNALASAKIMLSFARRVDKSFRFFMEGRVLFGERKDPDLLIEEDDLEAMNTIGEIDPEADADLDDLI